MYDWLYVAFIAIISECTGIYYAFFIEYLANFIIDKKQPISKGIWLLAIYLFMNFVTIVARNRYIHYGYMTSIRMRRTLCAVMFDKVTALSVESLAKTSSGKLIAMISSDLFALERSFTFASLILVFPVCNLFTFLYVGSRFGWVPALIVLGCFLVSFSIQLVAGHF
jgi:ABC-type multidrug transport system fused ATPase/permease subunit